MKATLSDGTSVNTTWCWVNAARMSPEDVAMILGTPKYDRLRKAMILGFAEVLRRVYRKRWCIATGRHMNAWNDTAQSLRAFEKAAVALAEERARRGMTVDLFLDAAQELRPKAVKYPTPQMLAGALSASIREWVPRAERGPDGDWSSYEDKDGLRWLSIAGDPSPVLLVNSPESRAALLKMGRAS